MVYLNITTDFKRCLGSVCGPECPSLAFRRIRGDAIETYKFMHNIYKVDSSSMPPLHPTNGTETRAQPQIIEKKL
jgi:hypothetical protein